ncbi:hypothetical protein GCM10010425_84160 [Streptomyces spororaveus]|uniref:Uncharacterized protein n=1 Tax=Streptomyces spororaveus TaxID=284039 RepID=A0ABQ3T2V1_9ACTN|nr:hypothetical protein Sspor_02810 [Streptomyces spororaveus]
MSLLCLADAAEDRRVPGLPSARGAGPGLWSHSRGRLTREPDSAGLSGRTHAPYMPCSGEASGRPRRAGREAIPEWF